MADHFLCFCWAWLCLFQQGSFKCNGLGFNNFLFYKTKMKDQLKNIMSTILWQVVHWRSLNSLMFLCRAGAKLEQRWFSNTHSWGEWAAPISHWDEVRRIGFGWSAVGRWEGHWNEHRSRPFQASKGIHQNKQVTRNSATLFQCRDRFRINKMNVCLSASLPKCDTWTPERGNKQPWSIYSFSEG